MKKTIALLAFAFSLTAFAGSDYSCMGTEPFWGLELVGNKVSVNLSLGDDEIKTEAVVSRIQAAGYSDGVAFVVKTGSASATIVLGECSDGMSDQVYTNHIVYTKGDAVLYGCCNQITKK
jgi:uncharacterized membrane protein